MTNEVTLDGIGLTQMIRPVPPFDTSTPPTDGQALVWDATSGRYRPGSVAAAGGSHFTEQYVDPSGSDSNDGKSWGSAKATVAAAYSAIIAASAGGARGLLYLSPGVHSIGTAGSSAVGLLVPQNVKVMGFGFQPGDSNQNGTELRYVGTGIAVQTTFNASQDWSHGLIQNLIITNAGSGTIGLNIRNPENASRVVDVRVGGSTTDTTKNFSVSACLIESTSTAPISQNNYPGFWTMRNCWFVGGATVVDCMTGVTQTYFDGCGIDSDPNTTVGFKLTANPTFGAGSDLVLMACKYEGRTDAIAYLFDANVNILAIGCSARQSSMGTGYAFQYNPAPTGPGFPRMTLLNCHALNFARWLNLPNLVVGSGFVGPALSSATVYTDSYFGMGRARFRRIASGGGGTGSGNYAASAGWGSTAAVSVSTGSQDQRGRVTVTAGGTGIAANPTVTLTFVDGSWNNSPFAVVARNDANSPSAALTWTTTATTLAITFNGTPVSGTAYTIEYFVIG
jgi:hypothetical protein